MAGLFQQGKELGNYFGDVAGNYGDALSSLFNPPLPPVNKPQGPVAWGRQVGVDYNQEMKSTPRSIRNNNPLSISLIEGGAHSPGGSDPWEGLAQRQTDVKLDREEHAMLQFKDPLHGIRAGYKNLKTQVNKHGADTMQKLATRHIAGSKPYSEQTPNKKAEIDQAVSIMRRHTNLGKNEKIDMSNMNVASGVFKALAMHETGREGNEFEMTLPDELITAGIGMALQPQDEDQLANARNFITTASGILPPSPQQPTPQQAGYTGFAMEDFGTPPPLKLGEPTGEYTPEGRPLFLNNRGGKSSEYSVGVTDPRINNKALTHIPSIYDGRILNQKDAIQEVVDAGGYDRLTGRYIEPGGDPNARSMSLGNIPHHIGGATTDTSRYRQQRLPSLQEAAQTAQVQPALNPFPWLNEVSGGYSHPAIRPEMYPQKKMFKGASMYPRPKNF